MAEVNEDQKNIKWNLDYFRTCSGYCKLILTVLNLLAFISASVASSKYSASQVTIFLFVSMISFWISLFIVGFYLFKFDEKFDKISFNTFGFYYSCIASIAYFSSSLMLIFLGGFLGAACFFGFMAFSVYTIELYLYYCVLNGKQPVSIIVNRSESSPRNPEIVTTESSSKSQIR